MPRLKPPTRQQFRDVVGLIDISQFRDAWSFSRRYNSSLWTYPDAARSNLRMLPRWIDPRSGLILDIGANEGSWTAEVQLLFPDARVHAWEPGPEPGEILAERFRDNPHVTVDRRALGSSAGAQPYYMTRSSVFASLLPPAPSLHELYPDPGKGTEVLETIDVPTVRLDDVIGERVSVVKLDVQGGERAVLEGGRRVISRADAVLVEVVYQPHYEGDATFGELHADFADLGFVLHDIAPPFRFNGPALWADACYVRAVPRVET